MTDSVSFAPDARSELEDAVEWYERREVGLGLEFLEAVTELAHRIARWPQTGAIVPYVRRRQTARRFPVRRFPYYLVWIVAGDDILIVAVAHNRRRPGYWIERV